jgi:hypothetical protein
MALVDDVARQLRPTLDLLADHEERRFTSRAREEKQYRRGSLRVRAVVER